MSAAHWHLMLNHIPLLGAILGLFLFLLSLRLSQKTLMITALGLLVFSAIMILPVYVSGMEAEEAVEALPGVSESYLETHEGWGRWSLISAGGMGLLALARLLLVLKDRHVRWLTFLLVGAALISVGIMAQSAYTGGEIRHPEIRTGTPPVSHEQEEPESQSIFQ